MFYSHAYLSTVCTPGAHGGQKRKKRKFDRWVWVTMGAGNWLRVLWKNSQFFYLLKSFPQPQEPLCKTKYVLLILTRQIFSARNLRKVYNNCWSHCQASRLTEHPMCCLDSTTDAVPRRQYSLSTSSTICSYLRDAEVEVGKLSSF